MFLANENFPKPSIILLREAGFHILSIQELKPGISDNEVVEIALRENLIILTFDRDYGEIVFRYSSVNKPGVIYFREKGADPLFAGRKLLKLLLEESIKFESAFSVIEQNNIRQRVY